MTCSLRPPLFLRRPSLAMALVCCLLSFDVSFVASFLDRHVHSFTRATLAEVDELPEHDDEMLYSRGVLRATGRPERETSPFGVASSCGPLPCLSHTLRALFTGPPGLSRPGCEHCWRNGLGAPLLC